MTPFFHSGAVGPAVEIYFAVDRSARLYANHGFIYSVYNERAMPSAIDGLSRRAVDRARRSTKGKQRSGDNLAPRRTPITRSARHATERWSLRADFIASCATLRI